MKYNHKEAFCLMTYKCEKCMVQEMIWNSRDGVTPFCISCKTCGASSFPGPLMQHINWQNDTCDPSYCPKKGERVFIDSTLQIRRIYERMKIERFWNHAEYPMFKRWNTKEEALDALTKDFDPEKGEPFILTV